MPLDIVTVPCLSDNYAYLVKGPDGVCVIDAPEAGPIIAALDERGWTPGVIMITHHHHDHVGGVDALKAKYGCKVMGPKAEEAKLPPLDMALEEGMNGGAGDGYTVPLHVPGHTLGHMAFHFPEAKAVFSADSLMALGCGRVFEGTPEMMWQTMQKFLALPDDTRVYSGHEYTANNARFALTVEPDNDALKARAAEIEETRARGAPTVPSTIGEEKATNPFLRAHLQTVKDGLNMGHASDADVFAEIRRRKDSF
ncbi:hydroxyacylglutathione hydrolase [Psychromarinibacter sp. C21-152]|uniref:Hydroxyacylglutathione hydrolase n=1 Tax=Psychromarinibacter sediminicola TaxID=3033385 RepID=A0AAE3NS87_9RHOB|nr:hydroxyacylglutathione hydrolase [Psychromarinibacter sediminicola]MDF0601491.1 hydroxyacylglutathione hydrolase [Psychromarinibacter sediminicola]